MRKYTIQAYNEGGIGRFNSISIVVQADTEEAAIKRAKAIEYRDNYAVVQIEDLDINREIRK